MWCRNTSNVHCFGTIFPNQNFAFESFCVARPVLLQSAGRIEKLPNCQNSRWVPPGWSRWGATKHKNCDSRYAKWHDIYTPERCTHKWMQNHTDYKCLCYEWFHHVRHHVPDGHSIGQLAIMIWRLDSFIVLSRGDVRGESGLRELVSVNRRTRLRNGYVAD